MIYEDPALFSGRRGVALAGVAALHVMVISAFYLGLARPIIQHFTAPIDVSNIPKLHEKVTVRPEPPKLDVRKLQIDPPQTSLNIAADPDRSVTTDTVPFDAKPAEKTLPPERAAVRGTAVQVDPKRPLRIGPDYYPPGSVRLDQEGRCMVQVTVAADGKIVDSSLQSSSGFPLLDAACLSAVRGQRMLPATQDGKPIQSTASVPIVWKLTGSR